MPRLIAVVLLLCAATTQVSAQVARGTIRDSESGAALQGVFVMLLDSAGQMRGGVLSDEKGFYAVRAPHVGTFTLRAERIGHESTSSNAVLLTADEARTVDFNVNVAVIRLAPVEVASRNRCVARPRSGQRTAQLWEEVRKALTVARWVDSERQVQFSARTYVRELDAQTMRVRSEGVRHEVSRKLPYAAIDADTLAKYGFVRNEGAGFVFYGPDADVLLSQAFLDSHCFHSVDGTGATLGMIGLTFKPMVDSKLPDIEGALWLDRNTLELRHIDYRYANLAREYRVRETGGRTEFVRLKSGAWIVSSWYIRMPTIVSSHTERGEFRLVALQEEGGEVVSIRDRDATQTLAPASVLKGLVYDSVAGHPLANAMVYLSGTAYQATTNAAGEFEIRGVRAGKYTVGFAHVALDSIPALPEPRVVDVRLLDSTAVNLATRSVRSQLAAKCPTSNAGVLFGYIRNERGTGVTNATVTAQSRRKQARRAIGRTDATGQYLICGVPLDDPIELRAARADDPAVMVPLRIVGLPFRRVDITIKD